MKSKPFRTIVHIIGDSTKQSTDIIKTIFHRKRKTTHCGHFFLNNGSHHRKQHRITYHKRQHRTTCCGCGLNLKQNISHHRRMRKTTHCGTDLRDQYFATRLRTRLLEKWSPRQRLLIIKSGARPGCDWESRAFILETETRTWEDLHKFFRFQIFRD